MGAAAPVHPSDETLKSYGLGKLDPVSAKSVNEHLDSCRDCLRRVAEMSSDTFLGRLRGANVSVDSAAASRAVSSLVGMSLRQAGESLQLPSPTSDLPAGLAGHPDYEVIRELGKGGMGTVYLVQNNLMDRTEVFKVVSGHMLNRPGILDRFLGEIRNAARLDHANIVTAYSALRFGDSIILAMEHVDGSDLARLVKSKGPLPVAMASNFAHQAAAGLQHAYEQGMVHRDIKPGNLMLAYQGKRAVIKVLDFGLAKVKSERAVDGGLTHEGQMLGTPDYVAPEQIGDARRADIRADIYSLGCTLYHLLSGAPPFQTESLWDLYQAHHSMEAKPLNFVRPEVPSELAALVAKMMAKDPARRFQTPADVAKALVPFFRKPFAVDAVSSVPLPAVEVSAPKTQTADAAALSSPNAAAPGAAPSPVVKKPAETAQPDVKIESLIKLDETEDSSDPVTTAVGLTGRKPLAFWAAIVAASIIGVLAIGRAAYVATDYGRVTIVVSNTKVLVLVDDKVVRPEALRGPIALRAGNHIVGIMRRGGELETFNVEVKRGQHKTVAIEDAKPDTSVPQPDALASRQSDRGAPESEKKETQVGGAPASGFGTAQRPAASPADKTPSPRMQIESASGTPVPPAESNALSFDGKTRVSVVGPEAFEMTNRDYTILARIKTRRGGTILSKTAPEGAWVPNGKRLFVKDGKLAFDVGWVDMVETNGQIGDDLWHNVAMIYTREDHMVRLCLNGNLDRQKQIEPKAEPKDHVVRIGFTATDLPHDQNFFDGQIADVQFYQRALSLPEIIAIPSKELGGDPAVARWALKQSPGAAIRDETGHGHEGKVERVDALAIATPARPAAPIEELKRVPMTIDALAFSPVTTQVAAILSNGKFSCIDLETGRQMYDWRDANFVTSVIVGPDGNLVTSHTDQVIRVWDKKDGNRIRDFAPGPLGEVFTNLRSFKHRKWIVGAGVTQVRIWKDGSGDEWSSYPAQTPIISLDVDSNQGLIASLHQANVISVWNAVTEEKVDYHDVTKMIARLRFSPDGNRLLCLSQGAAGTCWDLDWQNGQTDPMFQGAPTIDAAYLPLGFRVASITADKVFRVWSSTNGESLYAMDRPFDKEITGIAISPYAPYVVVMLKGETIVYRTNN